jgi:AraC family transcriptional regulator
MPRAIQVGRVVMEPTIVERDQIVLAGFSFFGDPFATSGGWTEENEIGRLWNKFVAYMAHHGDCIKHIKNPEACYEVHIAHEETATKGHFEVFVGVEISQLEDLPIEISVKMLPPTKYAVFTLKGKQITSDWPKMIYHDWMPGSGYQGAHSFMFQLYDRRFRGLEHLDASVLDAYVPVK